MAFQESIRSSVGFAGPLYAQVAAMLRNKISSAEWTPRAPIPNEVTLARDLGVSIGTMRKALEMLETERLIRRQQGRGTFVVEISDEAEVDRFSNIVTQGRRLHTSIAFRNVTSETANMEVALHLAISEGDQVTRVETLRKSSQRFRSYENVFVATAVCPDIEAHELPAGNLLFPLYRRVYKFAIASVDERVFPHNANAIQARHLGIDEGAAVLRIDRIARERSGGIIEWSRSYITLGEAIYVASMH